MRISLSKAIQFMQSGKVIGVPTETVYGLAACLNQLELIDQVFALKGRPSNNPLIIHLAHLKQIDQFIKSYPPSFIDLAEAFWPGSLTIVLPVDVSQIPSRVRANLTTAAFRVPNFFLTEKLIESVGPIVMPSANISGKPSATKPEHVEKDFGVDFPILDGGPCQKGLESTILFYHADAWVILRLGALTAESLKAVLGYQPVVLEHVEEKTIICPGQLFRHYAPNTTLILEKLPPPQLPKWIIGFKEREYPLDNHVLLLGSLSNEQEVATNFYDVLRQLDLLEVPEAWVDMDFPHHGLWQTIRERLQRAANKH